MALATERLQIKLHNGRFVHVELSDLGQLADELWRLGLHHHAGVSAAVKLGQAQAGFRSGPTCVSTGTSQRRSCSRRTGCARSSSGVGDLRR
jgi:hypothetical protein